MSAVTLTSVLSVINKRILPWTKQHTKAPFSSNTALSAFTFLKSRYISSVTKILKLFCILHNVLAFQSEYVEIIKVLINSHKNIFDYILMGLITKSYLELSYLQYRIQIKKSLKERRIQHLSNSVKRKSSFLWFVGFFFFA